MLAQRLLLVATLWSTTFHARAEDDNDTSSQQVEGAPEGYYRAINLGVDEFEFGNFEEARSRSFRLTRSIPMHAPCARWEKWSTSSGTTKRLSTT